LCREVIPGGSRHLDDVVGRGERSAEYGLKFRQRVDLDRLEIRGLAARDGLFRIADEGRDRGLDADDRFGKASASVT
jgi:hypothetical protein